MDSLANIMDGLDELLGDIVQNHYPWPVDSITVPCTVVGYPERIDYDATFVSDELGSIVVPVWYVVGRTTTKDARDRLSVVLSASDSVKSAVDGSHDFGDVRATRAQVATLTVNGVDYLAAKYDCEVI